MIKSGLVSVTFRKLSREKIITLVKSAGLQGIEWGGDIHVPHGDIDCAKDTRKMTEDAGLAVTSYGSYYRVGHEEPLPFDAVLETAVYLGAPIVRVWAGKQNAEESNATYWQRVIEDTRSIASLTSRVGKKIAFEYHNNTLTNTLASTLKLIKTVNHPGVTTYWQIPANTTFQENIHALNELLPWLSYIHVNTSHLNLDNDPEDTAWQKYIEVVRQTGRMHYALIEFVRDDNPEHFMKTAAHLHTWMAASQ